MSSIKFFGSFFNKFFPKITILSDENMITTNNKISYFGFLPIPQIPNSTLKITFIWLAHDFTQYVFC